MNNSKVKIVCLLILVIMITSCGSSLLALTNEKPNSQAQIELNDISTHWAKDTILDLVSRGVVNGYPDGTFLPESEIFVDDFIKMVVTSLGYKLDNGTPYWASTYIDKAKELGIIKDGEFLNYSVPINRAQMATIIVRSLNQEYPDNLETYSTYITDYNKIDDIYKSYVLKTVCLGIITGYPDGSFGGNNNATRAETCVVIVRMLDESKRVLPNNISDNTNLINSYTINDTEQVKSYNNRGEITTPAKGEAYYGQDGQYTGNTMSFKDNGDGTISDLNTGLMWIQERGSMVTWDDAVAGAPTNRTGGYDDWRMPTIKELYSLIQFNGVNGTDNMNIEGFVPFINTNYFKFAYGSGIGDDRIIDCQDWSGTEYVSHTQYDQETVFGVNFADGRIKGYKKLVPPKWTEKNKLYVRYVRGNSEYGKNNFEGNNDGTVTDKATGLMWSNADSQKGMDWPTALAWVQEQNAANYLGYSDWRMPTAKELQSIVDYTKSPAKTNSAAIDTKFFTCSTITNEAGQLDYPYFWSSTVLIDGGASPSATYIPFGRAMAYMDGVWQDVHGAGSQKSDLMTGDPSKFSQGRGPQGDAVRVYNYVRLVRTATN